MNSSAAEEAAQTQLYYTRLADSIREAIDRVNDIITKHLTERFVRNYFAEITVDEPDQLVLVTLTGILETLSKDERRLALHENIKLLENERNLEIRQRHEELLDNLFLFTLERGVITPYVCLEGLLSTCNFSLKYPFGKSKFAFIKKNIHLIGYKCIHSLFSKIIRALCTIPSTEITQRQRSWLHPIEDLMLYIMDRSNNLLPTVFIITELVRTTREKFFLFPRLAANATKFEMSFRAVAELISITGRAFLFPLPEHPMYRSTAPAWRINADNHQLHTRTLLPFRIELTEPQAYTLYQIKRQPKCSTEMLSAVLRATTYNSQTLRTDLSAVIANLLIETLSACEMLPLHEEIPRYQWENIFATLMNAVNNFITPGEIHKLMSVLAEGIRKTGFKRGRSELMFLLLQFVGIAPQNHIKSMTRDVIALHKLCFPGQNENIHFDSAHVSEVVRYLAPACILCFLEDRGDDVNVTTDDTEYLRTQIDFIRQRATAQDGKLLAEDDAMLAVCANAYRHDSQVLVRNVLPALLRKLDATPPSHPSSETLFILSYNRNAINILKPIPLEFLDNLSLRSKSVLGYELMKLAFSMNHAYRPDRLPSPGLLETFATLMQLIEVDRLAVVFYKKYFMVIMAHCLQDFGAFMPQRMQMPPQHDPAALQRMGAQLQEHREKTHIITDYVSFRLITVPLHWNARSQLCVTCLTTMKNGSQGALTTSMFFALEQLVLRIWCWGSWGDNAVLCAHLLRPKSHIWSNMAQPHMYQPQLITRDNTLPTSPQVIRILVANWFKNMKICGQTGTIDGEIIRRFLKTYPMPRSQLITFHSTICEINESVDAAVLEDLYNKNQLTLTNALHNDRSVIAKMNAEHMVLYFRNRKLGPTLLCIAYTMLKQNEFDRLTALYTILEEMNAADFIMCAEALADMLFNEVKSANEQNPNEPEVLQSTVLPMVQKLDELVFVYHLLPLDRLLYIFGVHPCTDELSKIGVIILQHLLSMPNFRERLRYYTTHMKPAFLPVTADFFPKLAEYHSRYPEFTYLEMLQFAEQRAAGNLQAEPVVNPSQHPPIYYGSVIDRIIPAVDYIFSRIIELNRQLPDEIFTSFLNNMSPLYAFHPYSLQFVYNTLFTTYDIVGHTPRARTFATTILKVTAQKEPFTQSFVESNHQNIPLPKIVYELAERFAAATEFILKPPAFVAQDWRFAETPPGVQAMMQECIEIMASPHPHDKIVSAMVTLLHTTPLARPHQTLNSLSLILNGLPHRFGLHLLQEAVAVIDEGSLNNISIERVAFGNFEEDVLLYRCHKVQAVIALVHAYFFQSNLATLTEFVTNLDKEIFEQRRVEKFTEKELFFFIRMLVPLLQRCYDARERSNMSKEAPDVEGYRVYWWTDCMKIIAFVYRLVGDVSCNVEGPFKFEDTISDLFYHFKYVYVGDYVRGEGIELSIEKMHSTIKEKLKHLTANIGTTDEDAENSTLNTSGIPLAAKISVDVSSGSRPETGAPTSY